MRIETSFIETTFNGVDRETISRGLIEARRIGLNTRRCAQVRTSHFDLRQDLRRQDWRGNSTLRSGAKVNGNRAWFGPDGVTDSLNYAAFKASI